jgi:serine/threonine-protein kinase PpkA
MGPDEQNQVIADLENKLNYYQQFNDDAARWIKLNKDEDASESVYPVPLEVLP